MTEVKKITKTLEDKAEKRQKEIDELETQISMDEAAIAEAEKNMNEAADQNDVTLYQQAKKSRQDSVDAKEMHQAHLQKITEVPTMNERDYEETIDEIKKESGQKVDELRKKVADITAELYPVQTELRAVSDDATAAMQAAHKMAFPDGKNSKGWVVSMPQYRGGDDLNSWIIRAIGNKNEREPA